MSDKKKPKDWGKGFKSVVAGAVATMLLEPEEQTAAIEASADAEIKVNQEDLEIFTKGYFAGGVRILGLILKGEIDVTLIKLDRKDKP